MRATLAAGLALAALLAPAPAAALDGYRVWHQGRELPIVDQDGWAIYGGDIILGRTEDVLARSRAEAPDGTRIGAIAKSLTVGTSGFAQWPRGPSGEFEVPYVAETDPDNNVPAAVALFNQQLAGFMRAVPRTTESDWIAFTLSATDTSGACASPVGRQGGRQIIQGSRLCGAATLVHEMGHAIGLWHEQEHADRASFINFSLAALDPARASNFATNPNERAITPYDYASTMHYSATTFSKSGGFTMESIPPGVAIGSTVGYSAADLEGIRRLYGTPPPQITVTSLPVGLQLIIDGAQVTTPATFNWAIGSTHTIDVPSNVQVLGGVAHTFARWNVDRNGDLNPRRTVTVQAGDGSIGQPTTSPSFSTYTASFVRYKQVSITTTGNRAGVGGTATPNPAPVTLPGVSGTFYRERTLFTIDATPNAGATFGNWGGGYFFSTAYTTAHRNPFRGPVAFSDQLAGAYEYRATFYDIPLLKVQARAEDGEVLGLRATVAPVGGTSADQRMPYNATSLTGGTTVTLTSATGAQSPFSSTMRYTFRNWDGDPAASITTTSPAAGAGDRIVTANFTKEYQAFRSVIPSCAASITIPNGNAGWYTHGAQIPVTLTAAPGWTFLGWEGTLSGTSTNPTYTVTDWPNFTARFNTINAPLAINAITPEKVNLSDFSPKVITIDGTGFTAASEVYLNGVRQVNMQFQGSTRLVVTLNTANIPASGLATVTVSNRSDLQPSCTVNASKSIDSIGTASAVIAPQTGWWWNPSESGRGFFIEKQGNNIFMAGYLYDTDGRATWGTAQGAMNGASFTAPISVFGGGQTLTGNYVAPTALPSPGSISITFTSDTTATMTWPGGTVPLTRFQVGSGAPGSGQNGWWWNAGEGGRGYSIEISGGNMFMVGFMYDAAGNPIWYLSQGTISGSTYTSNWLQFGGGQTLTGAYKPASLVNGNVGTLGLTFTGATTANLTLPNGRVVPITRFLF